MRLLADCGNTTVKLALARAGGIWLHERCAAEPAAMEAAIGVHLAAVDELAVLPGAEASTARVLAWWQARGGRSARVLGRDLAAPDCGQYAGFGHDRLAAGLAACAQERADVVVVDCGTATTLTAWRQVAGALPARFAGGLILPGARACSVGLSTLAPALPVVDALAGDAAAAQRDTHGALAAALAIGYPAMVRACRERMQSATGIAVVIATGGNAAALLGDVLPRRGYRPSLVCEGLELICNAADVP